MSRITKERMVGVLGPAAKPETVWEKQFDYDNEALLRLARCDWDQVPDRDLWFYIHDLTYVELQPELFRHLFPACLKFWYATLMRHESAGVGDADFHHALLHGEITAKMLNQAERGSLYAFFVDGFLDRLDAERGFEYVRPGESANAWIWRFNSLGIVAPIIPEIWRAWWGVETPGRAVCAIKYASGLIYLPGENPIYQPWTPQEGGGGPYLTEWDAAIYDRVWLDSNLLFLAETLTCDYVVERVSAAADRLRGEPEASMARRIANDAMTRTDLISMRIGDLLANLEKTTLSKDRWD